MSTSAPPRNLEGIRGPEPPQYTKSSLIRILSTLVSWIKLCLFGTSVSVTVMRITLMPSSRSVPRSVPAVDVVAKRLLLASAKVGTFPPEPRARPVLIKGHSLRHPHNIDHDIAPVLRAASCPDNQVPYVRQSSYLWLTGCQSAHAKERVWGESVIPSNNIRVQAHEQILEKNILRSRLSPHADIPLLAIGLDVQWFVPDAPLPKPANTPPSDNPRTRVCWANGAVPPADAPRTTPTATSRCQPSDPGAVTVDPDSAEAGRLVADVPTNAPVFLHFLVRPPAETSCLKESAERSGQSRSGCNRTRSRPILSASASGPTSLTSN